MKKILVSLPEGAWHVAKKELRGKLGESDSEIVRTVFLAYLSEKGYIRSKAGRAQL